MLQSSWSGLVLDPPGLVRGGERHREGGLLEIGSVVTVVKDSM
jgi:hypothetical protein